jgi:hypothetical protein
VPVRAEKTTISLVPMEKLLIGFALSPDQFHCANPRLNEFISIRNYQAILE